MNNGGKIESDEGPYFKQKNPGLLRGLFVLKRNYFLPGFEMAPAPAQLQFLKHSPFILQAEERDLFIVLFCKGIHELGLLPEIQEFLIGQGLDLIGN
jgi:hypothetical protein